MVATEGPAAAAEGLEGLEGLEGRAATAPRSTERPRLLKARCTWRARPAHKGEGRASRCDHVG